MKFVLLLLLVLLSCLDGSVSRGDDLRFHFNLGIMSEFEASHPILHRLQTSPAISNLVHAKLLIADGYGKQNKGLLAKVPDPIKDYTWLDARRSKALCLSLDEKARWSDGVPVTSADVKLSLRIYRQMLELGDKYLLEPRLQRSLKNIQNLFVFDSDPLRFCLEYRNFSWRDIEDLSLIHLVANHKEGEIFQSHSYSLTSYLQHSLYRINPSSPGLYSGAYKVESFEKGRQVTLVRNQMFLGPMPKAQKLNIRYLANAAELKDQLKEGALHMVLPFGLGLELARSLTSFLPEHDLPYTISKRSSGIFEHIVFNLKNKSLSAKLRRALSAAIDRRRLNRIVFDGEYIPAAHFLSGRDPLFWRLPSKGPDLFNLDYAKTALKELGWALNKKGQRVRKGRSLKVEVVSNAGDHRRQQVLEFIQNSWKVIGVDLKIVSQTGTKFFGLTVNKQLFSDAALYAWKYDESFSPTFRFASNASDLTEFVPGKSLVWKNRRLSQLSRTYEQEWIAMKRAELIKEIIKQYLKDSPSIPLFFRPEFTIISKNLSKDFWHLVVGPPGLEPGTLEL